MNKLQRGFVVTMAAAFLMTSTIVTPVLASGPKDQGNKPVKVEKTNVKADSKDTSKENDKAWKLVKDSMEAEKVIIEAKKETLEEQKESLEKQYEAAKKSGNFEQAKLLQTQIQQLKADIEKLKLEMKQKKDAIKANIKATYSNKELTNIKLAGDKIKKSNKKIVVLPVENVIVKGVNVKFDTPPVIKNGRTLIPVKALSMAFGAQVQWISAERKVIISQGTTVIILMLDSNKIFVNGVEQTIDVAATSINGRTVVPISFIAQKLGLKVNWHGDTKDVEIEAPTTTGGAIGTTSGSAIDTTSGSAIDTTSGSAIDTTTTPAAIDTTSGASIDTTTGTAIGN